MIKILRVIVLYVVFWVALLIVSAIFVDRTDVQIALTFLGPILILWLIERRLSAKQQAKQLTASKRQSRSEPQLERAEKKNGENEAIQPLKTMPKTRELSPDFKSQKVISDIIKNNDLFLETYRFLAIDVETANNSKDSICQIGIAMVPTDGQIRTACILVDPEQAFDAFNTKLHGIDQSKVTGAFTFEVVLQALRPLLERHILIQHSNFDKQAFDSACLRYGIPQLSSNWVDSVRIARNAWPELKGNGGHGLASLKEHLGLTFKHHDAEEDASAAAQVTILAERKTGKSFSTLAESKRKTYQPSIAIEGNQNGPLFGHVACFTGQLELSRVDASTLAASAGITVKQGMSKKVTLLIVGDQDMTTLAGHEKSSKHRKAEELILKGFKIRIMGETEFMNIIEDPK